MTNKRHFPKTIRQWEFDYGLFTNLPRVSLTCDFSPSSFKLERLLVSTGLLDISTFVISKFNSVWPNNNFCSLAHEDWLLLSISYHVVFDKTWYFYWNFCGSFLYDKLFLGYLLRMCQKKLLLKAFVFFLKVFSSSKTLKFKKTLKLTHWWQRRI